MKVKVVNINAVFRACYLETKRFHVEELRNILNLQAFSKTYSLCLLRFKKIILNTVPILIQSKKHTPKPQTT